MGLMRSGRVDPKKGDRFSTMRRGGSGSIFPGDRESEQTPGAVYLTKDHEVENDHRTLSQQYGARKIQEIPRKAHSAQKSAR